MSVMEAATVVMEGTAQEQAPALVVAVLVAMLAMVGMEARLAHTTEMRRQAALAAAVVVLVALLAHLAVAVVVSAFMEKEQMVLLVFMGRLQIMSPEEGVAALTALLAHSQTLVVHMALPHTVAAWLEPTPQLAAEIIRVPFELFGA